MKPLKNEVYDLLKTIAINVIPALTTFWLTISAAWNLPYGQQIGITIGAVGLLIAGCIGISKAAYEKQVKEQHEGGDADELE